MGLNTIQHLTKPGKLIIIILLFMGCCKVPHNNNSIPNQGELKPLWELKLPMGTSPYIYNGGLIRPPLYGSSIIFHTTLISNNEIEDNRLCAVNIITKQVDWLYPADTTKRYNYYFDSEGYIYKNYMVVKSTFSVFGSNPNIDVICFDMNTRETKWTVTYPTIPEGNQVGVIGDNEFVYHIKNRKEVYAINILTGEEEILYSINTQKNSDELLRMRIWKNPQNKSFIILDKVIGDDIYCTVYDVENKKTVKDILLQSDLVDGNLHVGYVVDNVYYYSCGHTVSAVDLQSTFILWTTNNEQFQGGYIQVANNVLIKYSSTDYIAFDKKTGAVLYSGTNIGTHWVFVNKDYLYMQKRDGKIYVIDLYTGKLLDYIVCPEESVSGDGFNGGVYPTVVDNKLYVMSYTTAYCYPTYPWK